jgi:DNA-binding response OmpR family regulator
MNARLGIATIDERPLPLTAHQFDLLFLLASRAGEYVDRETIAMRLRGRCDAVGRSTDVQVSRIRRRLRDAGVEALHVDTVHGRGYLLTLDASDDARSRAAIAREASNRAAVARHPGSGPVEQVARLS